MSVFFKASTVKLQKSLRPQKENFVLNICIPKDKKLVESKLPFTQKLPIKDHVEKLLDNIQKLPIKDNVEKLLIKDNIQKLTTKADIQKPSTDNVQKLSMDNVQKLEEKKSPPTNIVPNIFQIVDDETYASSDYIPELLKKQDQQLSQGKALVIKMACDFKPGDFKTQFSTLNKKYYTYETLNWVNLTSDDAINKDFFVCLEPGKQYEFQFNIYVVHDLNDDIIESFNNIKMLVNIDSNHGVEIKYVDKALVTLSINCDKYDCSIYSLGIKIYYANETLYDNHHLPGHRIHNNAIKGVVELIVTSH